MLIDMLIKTVSMGGNLIMNVGPTSRGCFDARAKAALGAYADWMRLHSRSIYGCTMAEPIFTAPRGTYLTQSEDGKRLYIHLIDYPFKSLSMDNIADKIDYAQFLTDGSEVLYTKGGVDHFSEARSQKEGLVAFKIPAIQPNTLVPVIEVFLK
jgi:alpha-L-fucosidase